MVQQARNMSMVFAEEKAKPEFLIMDMDSRLNVNAHGLMAELAWSKKGTSTTQTPPGFDATDSLPTKPGNLARDATGNPVSSKVLPRGLGYGPADISLRPALSPTLPTLFPNNSASSI